LLQRADSKFFAYNLSADGGMFIFTISKKEAAFRQLIKLVAGRQGKAINPAGRKSGKRWLQCPQTLFQDNISFDKRVRVTGRPHMQFNSPKQIPVRQFYFFSCPRTFRLTQPIEQLSHKPTHFSAKP
jgi:hypothetical protein